MIKITNYEVTVIDNRTQNYQQWIAIGTDIRQTMINVAFNYWNGEDHIQSFVAENKANNPNQIEAFSEDGVSGEITSACATFTIRGRELGDLIMNNIGNLADDDTDDSADGADEDKYLLGYFGDGGESKEDAEENIEIEPALTPVLERAFSNIVYGMPEKFGGKLRETSYKIIHDILLCTDPNAVDIDNTLGDDFETMWINLPGQSRIHININGQSVSIEYRKYDTSKYTTVSVFNIKLREDDSNNISADTRWNIYDNGRITNILLEILAANDIHIGY